VHEAGALDRDLQRGANRGIEALERGIEFGGRNPDRNGTPSNCTLNSCAASTPRSRIASTTGRT
jgi:hypothetical protein